MSVKNTETVTSELPIFKIILIIMVGLFIAYIIYQQSLWVKVDSPNISSMNVEQFSDPLIVYHNFIKTLSDKSIVQCYEIKNIKDNEKIIKTKSYSQYLEVQLKQQSMNVNNAKQQVWVVKKYRYYDPKDERLFLAELLAETVKSRDYISYYQILSQKLKEENSYLLNMQEVPELKDEKQRGMYEWFVGNSCLSTSLIDYTIKIYEDSYIISYNLIDTIPSIYIKRERVTFKQEGGKLVVASQYRPEATWVRYNENNPEEEKTIYFDNYISRDYAKMLKENDRRQYNQVFDTAKSGVLLRNVYATPELAMKNYTKAMVIGDYLALVLDSVSESFNSDGLKEWASIDVNDLAIIKSDIRNNKACYQLNFNLNDSGNTHFKVGDNELWLYLVKEDLGWAIEGFRFDSIDSDDWFNR